MSGLTKTRRLYCIAALHLVWATPGAGFAECEATKRPTLIPKGSWQVQEENDVLLLEGTDNGYTQGLRLGYSWQPECEWDWTQSIAQFMEDRLSINSILFGSRDQLTRWTSFGLGQHIFTPHNLARYDLNTNDRPYAGWLYFTLRHDYVTEEVPLSLKPWIGQAMTSLEYQVGLVGQASLAEWAQKLIHREFTGSQRPNAWEHQLSPEPGAQVRYQWQGRLAHQRGWFDVVPDYSVALGTIQTNAGAGLTLRAGANISSFPTRTLTPSFMKRAFAATPDSYAEDKAGHCGFSWLAECYVFANAEGRYFAKNHFLDARVGDNGYHVEKESFLRTWSVGFRLRLVSNNITLNYAYTWRSREFNPVPQDSPTADGSHAYGALTVNWDTHFN